MNTYQVLVAEYSYSHTYKPEPPAKPFDVFNISWAPVGFVKARTVERALAQAKRLGWKAPAVELAPPPKAEIAAKPAVRDYTRLDLLEGVPA